MCNCAFISHNDILFCAATSRKAATICLNVIRHRDARAIGTATAAVKWDLYSAVCLERHPVITQPMEEIELKFQDMLRKVEYENSLKSDFELKKESEKKTKKDISNQDSTDILIQTVQDIEDSYQEELNNFKFAPRLTSMP